MGINGIRTLYYIEDEAFHVTEKQTNHDADDVVTALSRKTEDGPGFETEDDLPESDFVAFATDDVEHSEEDPK
jgi:hypothetical protein